jgi:hypothetical protein
MTAAHPVEGYFNPTSDPDVVFAGKKYVIEKMILHPARINGAIDSSADMALLKLAQPVEGITPVLLYDKDDEVGRIIAIVGRGEMGTGLTGPVGERSPVPQGATNRIEAVFENSPKTRSAPKPGTVGPGPGLVDRQDFIGISFCARHEIDSCEFRITPTPDETSTSAYSPASLDGLRRPVLSSGQGARERKNAPILSQVPF